MVKSVTFVLFVMISEIPLPLSVYLIFHFIQNDVMLSYRHWIFRLLAVMADTVRSVGGSGSEGIKHRLFIRASAASSDAYM